MMQLMSQAMMQLMSQAMMQLMSQAMMQFMSQAMMQLFRSGVSVYRVHRNALQITGCGMSEGHALRKYQIAPEKTACFAVFLSIWAAKRIPAWEELNKHTRTHTHIHERCLEALDSMS